jgi:hypothetical protein
VGACAGGGQLRGRVGPALGPRVPSVAITLLPQYGARRARRVTHPCRSGATPTTGSRPQRAVCQSRATVV